jgi:uracil-DNA glycosylase
MSSQSELDAVASEIIKNKVCPQLASGATQLVPGAGSSKADLMFVGEAPGRDEDIQGLPFVGAAGKFLNEMLGTIGLKREDTFITNIVKYRPPNNRDPMPEEIQDFLPYLFRQIAIIKPKLLITLGRHAMNVFLPEAKISSVHGQPKRRKFIFDKEKQLKIVILPLFHPAAALYNGSMRETLLDDFAHIPKILKLINSQTK